MPEYLRRSDGRPRWAVPAVIALCLIVPETAAAVTPCVDGFAGEYPCHEVDLLAFMPRAQIGAGSANANDVWGWTDPETGREYAIVGLETGTSFVDISDPENPVYLGRLNSRFFFGSAWRDIKVYRDHAYIVADFFFPLNHGMQVFDLTRLRSVVNPPVSFSADATYNGFQTAHNVAIDEDTGFAYGLGTNSCAGGLHMIDISTPLAPTFAGCFSGDGYTHDAQCVVYHGPDARYQGEEVCFAANEDTLTVVRVTDKANPVMLSRNAYSGRGYAHQGWLTEDHAHFILGDELDEQNFGHDTRSRIWDVGDLEAPSIIGIHDLSNPAVDHNLYTRGNFVYEANYRSGLRILDLSEVSEGKLTEVAWFDVYPDDDAPAFNGAWSVYPYFDSGVLVVSGIEQGLFVLRPTHARSDLSLTMTDEPDPAVAGGDLTYTIAVDNLGPVGATGVVVDDTLPPEVTFESASASQGSCGHSAGTVTCDLGTIAIGGSATVTIEVTPDSVGSVSNTAGVSANEPDPDPSNDSASEGTSVLDAGADEDGDGVANGSDCAPLDDSVWAIPGPASALSVTDAPADNLTWNAPGDPGADVIVYDVLRSADPADFLAADCVESDDTDLRATDAADPDALFCYLVRAENACGGNLGADSNGTAREGAACP